MSLYRFMLLLISALCFALSSESGRAVPPRKPESPKDPYGSSIDDEPPLALVTRGNRTWLGHFDKEGNFNRHPDLQNRGTGLGSFVPRFVWCDGTQTLAHEHRSGRLIKGTIVAGGKGANTFSFFAPDIGSTIIDIKDVDLKNPDPDRRIWNMPEYLPDYAAARIRKYGEKQLPKAPDPPKAGTPTGWEFIPFSKSHSSKPPKYARAIADIVEFGHLSDEGDFIPDPDLPSVSRTGIRGGVFYDPFGIPCYYTVLAKPNQPNPKPEPVYEYRSGRLIKGMLHASGNFVPELGSQVMDFADYDPDRPPIIYNLPGNFKKLK